MAPRPVHCMLYVRDLKRSTAFYEKLAELQVVDRHRYPGNTLVFMRGPGSDFELELIQPDAWEFGPGESPRWHLAFGVEDLKGEHARLASLGFDPKPIEDFSPGGRFMNDWFYLYDPDGYQIEFLEQRGRFERKSHAGDGGSTVRRDVCPAR
jgi:lactoylglutathione lyase